MHYYKRNLGDYAKKAGRLTMLQHGAYTLLLDACYDREAFPTLDQALEWTWASTEAEIEAVKFVLSRFFVLNKEGCYVQDRILEELLHYHKNADTNKRIAAEREAKRREKSTNRVQVVDEPPPNHKPLTNNHKPITNKPVKTIAPMPHGIDARIWVDWIALRKSKKAAVTDTALRGIEREAAKAGLTLEQALVTCCERGWAGFKAEWVQDKRVSKAQQQQDRMINTALEWLQESK
jgi:uncharacterized protein YdaU (DUF1376 family)